MSDSRTATFPKAGREKKIVYKIAWSPLAFPASLKILATLAILSSLAFLESWLMNSESKPWSSGDDEKMSIIEETTTAKSNWFQLL